MSFANSPLCTVDVMSLKPSRFLLEAERRLPYRDENGKVHLALCRRSAGELDGVPDEVAAKLRKWVSHAERWAKSAEAPAWSRGADGVWRSSAGEERKELGALRWAAEGSAARQRAEQEAAALTRPASKRQRVSAAAAAADDDDDDGGGGGGGGGGARKISYKGAVQQSRYKSDGPSANVKQVVKGRAAVDASCPRADECHVYDPGAADCHDALLNQTDIANNHNKYYIIQLLETDAEPRRYYAWNRWGRVGEERNYQNALRGPMGLDDAKKDFEKKFRDKTKNEWDERDAFEPVRGKYTLILRDYGAPSDGAAADGAAADAAPPPPSELDARVQALVGLVCDRGMYESQMREIGFDASRQPLGKLQRETLRQGYACLQQIAQILDGRAQKAAAAATSSGGGGGTARSRAVSGGGGGGGAQLLELSNRFYTLVPHISYSEGGGTRARLPTIGTLAAVQAKTALVDALCNIELASRVMDAKKEGPRLNPIDAAYAKMKTALKPLAHDSAEHRILATYVANSHAPTHNTYTLELEQAYDISREGEKAAFVGAAVGNRALLWHGSRLTNWCGILSQGLRIAPPEAPATGYMFGKGVYFADMVSKSANYCFATKTAPRGLLLLCDVALGTPLEREAAEPDAPEKVRRAGKHSLLGKGKTAPDPKGDATLGGMRVPLGTPKATASTGSSLLYNEYVVYDVKQVRQRYALMVKFHYK